MLSASSGSLHTGTQVVDKHWRENTRGSRGQFILDDNNTGKENGVMDRPSWLRNAWRRRRVFAAVVTFTALLVVVYTVTNTRSPLRLAIPALGQFLQSRASAVFPRVAETSTAAETMLRRAQVLKQRCQELRGPIMSTATFKTIPRSLKTQIIVNDRYNVMFCWIPKIACTNFKRMFLMLSGRLTHIKSANISHDQAQDIYQKKYLRFLDDYNETDTNYILKHYRKVMFVREPFERLLSAYRDKISDTGPDDWTPRYKIIAYIKNHIRNNKNKTGGVTFDEFTRYVIHKDEARKTLNMHWRTYIHLCQPCTVQYDIIGKYDSLEEDGNALLDIIGANSSIRFPERKGKHAKTNDVLQNHYKNVTSVNLRKLKEIYANDSYLFDYEFPNVLEPYLNDHP